MFMNRFLYLFTQNFNHILNTLQKSLTFTDSFSHLRKSTQRLAHLWDAGNDLGDRD